MIFSSGLGSVEQYAPETAVRSIANHVRRIQEELEYRLAHLDSSNISEINADETIITGGPITLLSQSLTDIAQLKLTDRQIEAGVQGLGDRVSGIQLQADGLTAAVEQQGRSISVLEQTAGGLTATVQSIGGDISTLQQTSNSLSATVTNLGNSMSQTIRVAADGVTITNAAGSTLTIDGGQIDASKINTGDLNLTGKITFADLDAETQNAISSAGSPEAYLESIGITEITVEGVKAPRIVGGEIYGGIFSDLEKDSFIRMQSNSSFDDPNNWHMGFLLEHYAGSVDSNLPVTQMGYVALHTPSTEVSSWVLMVLDNIVLYRDTKTGTMRPQGKWDFSGATVTGL